MFGIRWMPGTNSYGSKLTAEQEVPSESRESKKSITKADILICRMSWVMASRSIRSRGTVISRGWMSATTVIHRFIITSKTVWRSITRSVLSYAFPQKLVVPLNGWVASSGRRLDMTSRLTIRRQLFVEVCDTMISYGKIRNGKRHLLRWRLTSWTTALL